MRVLTLNVWFARHAREERNQAIIDILWGSGADCVCLQEVLPDFAQLLAESAWVTERYSVSDPTGDSFEFYGVLMLVRRDLEPVFSLHTLPTAMGRKLLAAACTVEGREVTVATVHLESLDSRETRGQQLEEIAQILTDPAILVGDFNFCSYRNFDHGGDLENDVLAHVLPGFVDVWPALRGDEPGYTYDARVNQMIRSPRADSQMRYDRVLAAGLTPTTIELIGTEPIDDAHRVFPSDHFGLVADFSRR